MLPEQFLFKLFCEVSAILYGFMKFMQCTDVSGEGVNRRKELLLL